MDSKAELQAIETNLESNTQEVSQFSVVRPLHNLSRSIQMTRILQNI